MVRKIYLILFILLLSFSLKAQQETLYSVFWNNSSVFNPAYTGEQSKYYFSANIRNQWTKVQGNPLTINGNLEWQIDSLRNAIGLSYTYDKLGLEKNNTIKLNYSHHFKISKDKRIGIGIAPTFATRKFEFNNFVTIDDQTYDPSIPSGEENYKYFDLSFGLSYISNHMKVGISSTQLLESSGTSDNLYRNARHFYGNASYDINVNQKIKIIPQIMIGYVNDYLALNTILLAKYREQYWIGGSFSNEEDLGVMAGVDIAKKFRLGYAFNYYSTSGKQPFGETHEIVFAIILN